MALLVVIWVVALLSLLAAGLAATARSGAVLARNREESALAQALAEAGVSLAILGLLEADAAGQWRADGEERHFALDGGRIDVSVQDEGGKIDLNYADEMLLSGFFSEFVEPRAAADLASAIVARRIRRPGDATPRALFATVDEVRELPEIDPLLFEQTAPFLTVYSWQPNINPRTAPREALLAKPGVAPAEVDRLLAMRSDEATSPGFAGTQAQVVSIRAAAETDGGSVFVRETVVSLLRNSVEPYRILTWRRGD
jgi:general secretion pathway protein K